MTLHERLRRTRDWAALRVALSLPLRVRYWATIHEIGKSTSTSKDVPATSLSEILDHLEQPKNLS